MTAVPSPCINVCTMDPASGWCQGCLRTLDEIAGWGRLPEDAKRSVLAALPRRRVEWAARRAGIVLPAAALAAGARPTTGRS